MAERASSDPLLRQFFAQLPPDLRTDFTDRQLAALKRVFGDATREGHAFDVHLSLPVTPRGVYLVLLGGLDCQRGGDRKRRGARRGLSRIAEVVVGTLFVLQLVLATAGLLFWIFSD